MHQGRHEAIGNNNSSRLKQNTVQRRKYAEEEFIADNIALLAFAGVLLLSGIMRQQRRMNFRGASVVITGGSRGLGLEMSRLFAREGARLTLLARDREELERARKELIALGGYVMIQECDIGDPDQIAAGGRFDYARTRPGGRAR